MLISFLATFVDDMLIFLLVSVVLDPIELIRGLEPDVGGGRGLLEAGLLIDGRPFDRATGGGVKVVVDVLLVHSTSITDDADEGEHP
jgi:hypothetical protein